VEVTQGHLVNLTVVKLIELVYFCRGVILTTDTQSAIHVRACHLELVEETFLSKFR
jgi:hypothetical protein